MKYILYLVFLVGVLNVRGQNLVKNPGFEKYWKLQQFAGYETDTFFCKNWYIPKNITVDYYREGNFLELGNGKIIHVFDVPNNLLGYHPAIEGKSYIGFIPLSTDGGMEHIFGELNTKLVKDKVYEVSFYIEHGGDSVQYSATKFEVKFFNQSNFFRDKKPFNTKYVLDMFTTSYKGIFEKNKIVADVTYDLCQVNDTNEWVKVTSQYTAKGGESYFGLGLFYQGEELKEALDKYMITKKEKKFLKSQSIIKKNKTYIKHKDLYGNKGNTYYFIDEISVVEQRLIKKP